MQLIASKRKISSGLRPNSIARVTEMGYSLLQYLSQSNKLVLLMERVGLVRTNTFVRDTFILSEQSYKLPKYGLKQTTVGN